MVVWEAYMVMQQGALNEWTAFLEQLRNELQIARNRLSEAEADVGRLGAEAQAVEDSIAAYLEHHDMPIPDLPVAVNGHDLTLAERRRAFLLDAARRNGGLLVQRDVRDPMVQAGLFRDGVQFRQQMPRILEDMECWTALRRGVRRLINGHEVAG